MVNSNVHQLLLAASVLPMISQVIWVQDDEGRHDTRSLYNSEQYNGSVIRAPKYGAAVFDQIFVAVGFLMLCQGWKNVGYPPANKPYSHGASSHITYIDFNQITWSVVAHGYIVISFPIVDCSLQQAHSHTPSILPGFLLYPRLIRRLVSGFWSGVCSYVIQRHHEAAIPRFSWHPPTNRRSANPQNCPPFTMLHMRLLFWSTPSPRCAGRIGRGKDKQLFRGPHRLRLRWRLRIWLLGNMRVRSFCRWPWRRPVPYR
jgi:hypothetical protein